MERFSRRRCGAVSQPDGAGAWWVWVPAAKAVELVLLNDAQRRIVAMDPEEHGFFSHAEPVVADGQQRYAFGSMAAKIVRIPARCGSRHGVPGPSAIVRTEQFAWTDTSLEGRAAGGPGLL